MKYRALYDGYTSRAGMRARWGRDVRAALQHGDRLWAYRLMALFPLWDWRYA